MARSRYPRSSRRKPNLAKQFASVAVLLICVAVAAYQSYEKQHASPAISNTPAAVASSKSNLLLGNPSKADRDANNFLLVKPYFVVSYNNQKGEPHWVSWRLSRDDLGDAPRRNKFSTDTTLPEYFNRVSENDYTNSGFDRGHLCPHGDRMKNQEMSYATFVMSNIVPQSHELNERAWAMLEIYCRDLAKDEHDRLYIVAGGAGAGGTGSHGYREGFANHTVVVPAKCWKVIAIVPDDGTEDLTDITPATRVIAVIMPNMPDVGYDWSRYRVSPAEVETLTGYRFFTALPADVSAALRQKVDRTYIAPARPPEYHDGNFPVRGR
jgi:endonuclease G